MTHKLFSYGTLQLESVQLANFGRKLVGKQDSLMQYELRDLLIKDEDVVNVSGKAVHTIACFTGNPNDVVSGMVFDVTEEEMQEADKYEVDDYKKIKCILKSGIQAWVYVQSGLDIDIKYFQQDQIRLELFDDKHIEELCYKAQENKIWQYQRLNYQKPENFKFGYIENAKNKIAKKERYMFVIYFNNEIIGSTSYYDIDLQNLTLSIGYSWIHPDYWGNGINKIIKKLMLSYAFDHLKFKRISFCIDSENLRSRKAIENLGIPLEGILQKHQIRVDGSSRDSAIYAITDEVWKNKNSFYL